MNIATPRAASTPSIRRVVCGLPVAMATLDATGVAIGASQNAVTATAAPGSDDDKHRHKKTRDARARMQLGNAGLKRMTSNRLLLEQVSAVRAAYLTASGELNQREPDGVGQKVRRESNSLSTIYRIDDDSFPTFRLFYPFP